MRQELRAMFRKCAIPFLNEELVLSGGRSVLPQGTLARCDPAQWLSSLHLPLADHQIRAFPQRMYVIAHQEVSGLKSSCGCTAPWILN